jgi:hypothetical protein
MAGYISPRPGLTQHPLTIHAAAHMVDLVERANMLTWNSCHLGNLSSICIQNSNVPLRISLACRERRLWQSLLPSRLRRHRFRSRTRTGPLVYAHLISKKSCGIGHLQASQCSIRGSVPDRSRVTSVLGYVKSSKVSNIDRQVRSPRSMFADLRTATSTIDDRERCMS